MYTQEKTPTEMSKTQSSALYKHMQQKGKLWTQEQLIQSVR